MDDKKQKKLKNIIFKVLHIICYILSICFIGICILACVQSCDSKSQNQIEGKQHNAVITSSQIVVDIHDFDKALVDYIINSNNSYLPTLYEGSDATPDNYPYISLNSSYNQVSTIRSGYNQYSDGLIKFSRAIYNNNGSLYYRLYFWPTNNNGHITMFYIGYSNSGTYKDIVSSYGDYASQVTYIRSLTFTSSSPLYSVFVDYFNNLPQYNDTDLDHAYDNGYEVGSSEGYLNGYSEGYDSGYSEGLANGGEVVNTYIDKLFINYDFDFRTLLGSSLHSETGLIYSNSPLITPSLDLTGLTFKCNGIVYNTIRLVFFQYGDAPIVCGDLGNATGNEGFTTVSYDLSYLVGSDNVSHYYALTSVLYLNIDENDNILNSVTVVNGYSVTSTKVISDPQSGIGIIHNGFDYREPQWTNSSFRVLEIINDDMSKVDTPAFGENLSTFELISNGGSFSNYNIATLDVFDLLTGAFNSVSGIFAISILPNLTIGVLFFLPLVVALVVIIIRIIKKG